MPWFAFSHLWIPRFMYTDIIYIYPFIYKIKVDTRLSETEENNWDKKRDKEEVTEGEHIPSTW